MAFTRHVLGGWLFFLLFLAASLPCLAQGTPPASPPPTSSSASPPDVAALQRQIDELQRQLKAALAALAAKGGSPPAASAAVPQVAANPAKPLSRGCLSDAAGNVYCPGWVVDVLGVVGGKRSPDRAMAGRFIPSNSSRIGLHDHLASIDFKNDMIEYHGSAFFDVKRSGSYSFTTRVDFKNYQNSCAVTFSVGGATLISHEPRPYDRDRTGVGSVPLEVGLHSVDFSFFCTSPIKDRVDTPVLSLGVLAEGEFAPRPFRPGELVHQQNS